MNAPSGMSGFLNPEAPSEKSALVTGASRGVGAEIAGTVVHLGATVPIAWNDEAGLGVVIAGVAVPGGPPPVTTSTSGGC